MKIIKIHQAIVEKTNGDAAFVQVLEDMESGTFQTVSASKIKEDDPDCSNVATRAIGGLLLNRNWNFSPTPFTNLEDAIRVSPGMS